MSYWAGDVHQYQHQHHYQYSAAAPAMRSAGEADGRDDEFRQEDESISGHNNCVSELEAKLQIRKKLPPSRTYEVDRLLRLGSSSSGSGGGGVAREANEDAAALARRAVELYALQYQQSNEQRTTSSVGYSSSRSSRGRGGTVGSDEAEDSVRHAGSSGDDSGISYATGVSSGGLESEDEPSPDARIRVDASAVAGAGAGAGADGDSSDEEEALFVNALTSPPPASLRTQQQVFPECAVRSDSRYPLAPGDRDRDPSHGYLFREPPASAAAAANVPALVPTPASGDDSGDVPVTGAVTKRTQRRVERQLTDVVSGERGPSSEQKREHLCLKLVRRYHSNRIHEDGTLEVDAIPYREETEQWVEFAAPCAPHSGDSSYASAPSSRPYYYNPETKATVWELPLDVWELLP